MALELLKGISRFVSSAAPLEAKLAEAAALISTGLGVEEAAVYLRDSRSGRFDFAASSGRRPGAAPDGEGLIEEAAARGVAVWRELDGGSGVREPRLFRSAAASPLADARRVRGVVLVKSTRKGAFTERKVEELNAAAIELVHLIKYDDLVGEHRSACRELRDALARLNRAEKLVYLGDMAAPLAHEIRNPLVSIGGLAQRLKKAISSDPAALRYAEAIVAETRRLEAIVNGAMRFLKESALELREDDLNAVLDDTLSIFEGEIRDYGIAVVREYRDGPLMARIDREQLKIAFDNIIANAIQSMEHGGTLTVSTSVDGDWVVAGVADSGGGIRPEDVERIFNPFFTTKEHGTGLGLPITNSIVMRHNGVVEVSNRPGAGVTFSVKLPSACRCPERPGKKWRQ